MNGLPNKVKIYECVLELLCPEENEDITIESEYDID